MYCQYQHGNKIVGLYLFASLATEYLLGNNDCRNLYVVLCTSQFVPFRCMPGPVPCRISAGQVTEDSSRYALGSFPSWQTTLRNDKLSCEGGKYEGHQKHTSYVLVWR